MAEQGFIQPNTRLSLYIKLMDLVQSQDITKVNEFLGPLYYNSQIQFLFDDGQEQPIIIDFLIEKNQPVLVEISREGSKGEEQVVVDPATVDLDTLTQNIGNLRFMGVFAGGEFISVTRSILLDEEDLALIRQEEEEDFLDVVADQTCYATTMFSGFRVENTDPDGEPMFKMELFSQEVTFEDRKGKYAGFNTQYATLDDMRNMNAATSTPGSAVSAHLVSKYCAPVVQEFWKNYSD